MVDEQVRDVLEQRTVHFVAASFGRAQPVEHKLYFSQWLTPESRPAVEQRLARVLELYALPAELRAHWATQHARSTAHDDATLFVSIGFTRDSLLPSVKIDYPELGPARAAVWAPADEQPRVLADAESICALAGTTALSFLGVRLTPERAWPALKYYCDLPASAP
jgi:hypothetical protein